ncbi:MAG TPA: hypothetical protein VNT75_22270, partial [Symbiobacteriaceae bacterium]|nr:hypothetical protein [Symbiobacteriaceae bacterium]
MRRLRSLLAALVIALSLVMALVLPAAADPGNGQTVHPLLTVDPVPGMTTEPVLTLSGKVLGSFDMELRNNGAVTATFHGHGNFALPVTLNPGVNYLYLHGVDPTDRHVYWSYAIFYRTPPTQLTLHLTGPGLAPDGTSTTQVTAIARDAAGNIAYDAVGTVTFTS